MIPLEVQASHSYTMVANPVRGSGRSPRPTSNRDEAD
ncbi:MAG: hypothetical protein UX17_C0029G0002 [Parcubacteria group bacterium GW2011_GWC2_45_7]|nr:MAG: hypothetical protein UX17_C0029G0002 [Parcubacteria group bacterium GW2011_GWC2_45_7]KKU73530.1 MAG: hypothetical protein UX98_C0006G0028 [Parcubacteria group bacterium GW2011_GWA2_47_26]